MQENWISQRANSSTFYCFDTHAGWSFLKTRVAYSRDVGTWGRVRGDFIPQFQQFLSRIETKSPPSKSHGLLLTPSLWQYGLWSFQMGGTKLERFLPNNQHTQRKLLNFENWVNGEVSKSAKIWLSKSIFYVKNYPNLSQFFFSLKNINLGAHFLLLTFFENFNF